MFKTLIAAAGLGLAVLAAALAGCAKSEESTAPNGKPDAAKQSPPAGGAGASSSVPQEKGKMVAAKGDSVSVNYTGKLKDGTVFDSSAGKAPLTFTVGAGQLIKGFDTAVVGMAVGEKKTVEMPPEQAYGSADPRGVMTVPKAQLGEIASKVKKGDRLGMGTPDGRRIPVRVTDVAAETVTVDANHELAGKTLIFDIEVVSIKAGK